MAVRKMNSLPPKFQVQLGSDVTFELSDTGEVRLEQRIPLNIATPSNACCQDSVVTDKQYQLRPKTYQQKESIGDKVMYKELIGDPEMYKESIGDRTIYTIGDRENYKESIDDPVSYLVDYKESIGDPEMQNHSIGDPETYRESIIISGHYLNCGGDRNNQKRARYVLSRAPHILSRDPHISTHKVPTSHAKQTPDSPICNSDITGHQQEGSSYLFEDSSLDKHWDHLNKYNCVDDEMSLRTRHMHDSAGDKSVDPTDALGVNIIHESECDDTGQIRHKSLVVCKYTQNRSTLHEQISTDRESIEAVGEGCESSSMHAAFKVHKPIKQLNKLDPKGEATSQGIYEQEQTYPDYTADQSRVNADGKDENSLLNTQFDENMEDPLCMLNCDQDSRSFIKYDDCSGVNIEHYDGLSSINNSSSHCDVIEPDNERYDGKHYDNPKSKSCRGNHCDNPNSKNNTGEHYDNANSMNNKEEHYDDTDSRNNLEHYDYTKSKSNQEEHYYPCSKGSKGQQYDDPESRSRIGEQYDGLVPSGFVGEFRDKLDSQTINKDCCSGNTGNIGTHYGYSNSIANAVERNDGPEGIHGEQITCVDHDKDLWIATVPVMKKMVIEVFWMNHGWVQVR